MQRDTLPFKIFVTKVNPKLTTNNLIKYINNETRTRVAKQRVKQISDCMIFGDILAKIAIKKTFSIDVANQKFAYTTYGKPYLSNHSNVHFNISHSGEYVVCAVYNKPIGIDIQKIGEYNPDVAKRVCNEKELKQIEDSLDKASEFTMLWTQKEAVLKMYGTGIASGDIKNCLKNQKVQSKKIDDYWLSVAISIDRA